MADSGVVSGGWVAVMKKEALSTVFAATLCNTYNNAIVQRRF
jgi:hypothetical protein